MALPKPSLRSLFQEKETPPPPSGQPLGLDSIEGVFKKFSPGEKITHAEAKILNEQGRLFDENSMPRFNAPRSFYQNEARRRVAKWDEQAINILDATSEITSPIWKPFTPNMQVAFTEEQKQKIRANRPNALEDLKNTFLWSENTTKVLGDLVTGKINEGDAINALAEEFQNRSISEQIVGSVVGDPFMAGEAIKAMSFIGGLPPLIGRLKPKNSFKLPNRAKDDDLNMNLGFFQNIKNNAIKMAERWPDNKNLDSIGLFFSEGIVDKFSYVNKITAQAQRKWQNLHCPDALLPDNLFADTTIAALIKEKAAYNKLLADARKNKTIKPTELTKQIENYNSAVSDAIDAESGMALIEGAMITVSEGGVTGLSGVVSDAVLRGGAFFGMDLTKNYGSKTEVRNAMKAALQKTIPVTLGRTQSANSISNRDVDFLITAYFGEGALDGGILTFAAETETEMVKRLQRAHEQMQNAQKGAFATIKTTEAFLSPLIQPGTSRSAAGLLSADRTRLAEAGLAPGGEEGFGTYVGGQKVVRQIGATRGDDGVIRLDLSK